MNGMTAPIALLTDFGLRDGYVGVMKGVVASIAPTVPCIDISHEVPAQDILTGAWILKTSYRYFPEGTVFLCVVDPGVGSTRRAIVVHAGNWFFVGPDNGLFSYIYKEQQVHEVVQSVNKDYHLPHVSSTFHGRDIFAPSAAFIARGIPLRELGPALPLETVCSIVLPEPVRTGSQIEGHIIHVDYFGNLITDIPLTLVPEFFTCSAVQMVVGEHTPVIQERRRFFDAGDTRPFLYGDSSGHIAIAIHNGNAAQALGKGYGTAITLVMIEQQ